MCRDDSAMWFMSLVHDGDELMELVFSKDDMPDRAIALENFQTKVEWLLGKNMRDCPRAFGKRVANLLVKFGSWPCQSSW